MALPRSVKVAESIMNGEKLCTLDRTIRTLTSCFFNFYCDTNLSQQIQNFPYYMIKLIGSDDGFQESLAQKCKFIISIKC